VIPRTLSASSLQVAQLCLARWKAEYMERTPGFSNAAADVGTAVHAALEMYVKAVYIEGTHAELLDDRVKAKELLLTFVQMGYVQTFQSADLETNEYNDVRKLAMDWFARTNFDGVKVISAEVKKTIPVPYNHPDGTVHEVPFNYIMDRVDQLGEKTYRVVDYKSVRVPIQPDDLETKLQARAYALAIQIEHPDAEKIIVMFDLLRHQPVAMTFSRDDNINFWRFLCAETHRIVDIYPAEVKPVLNPECGYCAIKMNCPLMQKNIANQGYHSLSIDEKAKLAEQIAYQIKANNRILDELDEAIMLHASQTDMLHWTTDDGTTEVEIGITGGRRSFDAQQAASIMGQDLFAQMGNMTLGNLEKIIKDESLDKDMRDRLAALIQPGNGNLKVFVKPKKTVI